MHIKSIQFISAVLVGLLMSFSSFVVAEDTMVKKLWIDGYGYEAKLTESQINGVVGSGDDVHYKGHFPEDQDSWVRVSRLEDGWEGLAFVFNRLHTIRSGDADKPVASFSFSHQQAPQCGMDHLHADSSITPDSLASTAMAQAVTANYDTLCADKVDGACLMLELELAFDQQFQSRFPNDFEGRAGAIINMVEGFYQAQFGIIFDTLSLTFLKNEVFSTTVISSDLLNDIAAKRDNGNASFLKSKQSIFHFITDRPLENDFGDTGVAGIAFLGTLCSNNGSAAGLSKAFPSNVLTSIVVAHEIGHNLGARHDSADDPGGNVCPTGQNIMTPTVSDSISEFSSCSEDYITTEISNLDEVGQCFNFPADAGIEALAGNPSDVTEGEVFQADFDVVYQDASQPAESLAVEGSIGSGEGRLEQVTLNGAACNLTSDTAFSCAPAQARTGLRLTVQVTAGGSPTINLAQGVALISDEVKDIRRDNDTLLASITVANNGEFVGSTSGGGSSGGGGGGSIGWFWLLAGLAGVGRLTRRTA